MNGGVAANDSAPRSVAALSRSNRGQLLKMVSETGLWVGAAIFFLAVLQAAAVAVSIVATGVAVGAVPGAVEGGLGSDAGHRLVTATLVSGVAFLAMHAQMPFQSVLVESLGRRIDGHVRERLMCATCRPAGVAHFDDPAFLDEVRNAQGVGDGQFTAGGSIAGMTRALENRLQTLTSAALVLQFRWWLAPVLITAGAMLRRRLVTDLVSNADAATPRSEALRRSDYFRCLNLEPAAAKETRIFGIGPWVTEQFRAHWVRGMHPLWDHRRTRARSSWPYLAAWSAALALTLFLAARAAAAGEISLELLAIVVQAGLSASYVAAGSDDVRTSYGLATIGALRRVEELAGASAVTGKVWQSPPPFPSSIWFHDVSFRYPGQPDEALRHVDMEIPAGRLVAIVGPNGAGKTTLVKLLAGLHEPSSGLISVGEVPLCEIDPDEWRRSIAIIFQDFLRLELSAADNVAFGRIERACNRRALEEAARRGGMLPLIERLPRGWDTKLSRQFSDSTELSGGEWQRVALSRAMFGVAGGARLLVLDEPAAGLDADAEAAMLAELRALMPDVTVVLITHRLSAARQADLVCVLDGGRVVGFGSHDELLETGGRYAQLFSGVVEASTASASWPCSHALTNGGACA